MEELSKLCSELLELETQVPTDEVMARHAELRHAILNIEMELMRAVK